MSKAPENRPQAPAAIPPNPAARNSPINPPGTAAPGRKLDPAAVMIGVGGVVLLLAVWWLLVTPRSSSDGSVDPARVAQIEQRIGTLDGLRGEVGALGARVQQSQALEGRIRSLEERPAAQDIGPLNTQLAGLVERLAAAERSLAQGGERDAALDRRFAALEGRPAFDPATVAPRDAFDALAGRSERLAERIEAQGNRAQEQAKAIEEREAAAQEAATKRIAALEASVGERVTALEASARERVAALDTALGKRLDALETAQQRLTAIESRTSRMAAVDGVRGALLAGQPLGEALGRIDQPPAALARFATVAPPTESALRLSFEDAARAGRAASDAAMQPDGSRGGVVDSALSRLGGLVTVRRGDQVVWGDAAEAEIERARRALEAGDIEMSLQHVDKLPPPARAAMQPWADQARALIAARAALRQLAMG